MMDYLQDLNAVINRLHNCDSTHLETIHVKEVFRGATVWEGDVEVFAIHGHPKAAKCYAWGYQDGKETRYVTMLGLPPVDSPWMAVRAAIAGGGQK